jgi:hypothetical protein
MASHHWTPFHRERRSQDPKGWPGQAVFETWLLVVLGVGLILRSVRNSVRKGLHRSWLSTGGYLGAMTAVLLNAQPPVVLVCVVVFGVGELLHQTGPQGIPEESDPAVLREQLEREARRRARRGTGRRTDHSGHHRLGRHRR